MLLDFICAGVAVIAGGSLVANYLAYLYSQGLWRNERDLLRALKQIKRDHGIEPEGIWLGRVDKE